MASKEKKEEYYNRLIHRLDVLNGYNVAEEQFWECELTAVFAEIGGDANE